jgi:HEAT repeat protein
LWSREKEPVDSPAAVDAMCEWMARTYNVKRLYWRGGGEGIWDEHFHYGRETPSAYDWAVNWKRHLFREVGLNDATVASAHRHGMEVYLYGALFDHGVQPDVGIIGPELFEDRLRIEHPEWCSVDRWGERRCPGPLSFAFPEVRRVLVDRYVEYMIRGGYDGINFYTYVENYGIRYENEFGFEQPVVDEFIKRFPDVDLRRDKLTTEQKRHWYACRGKFVTDFLRELHTAMAAHGKQLSIILDANEPDYAQPWWSQNVCGTGMIHMDWQKWIAEGIVDELWVQLGDAAKQRHLLDRLLTECRGKPVRLTFRTPARFDADWQRYVEAGVTPVAVITAPVNGIERYTLEPTGIDGLCSTDWRLRAQSLADIATGKLRSGEDTDNRQVGELVAKLACDPHLLVRRKAMHAMKALSAHDQTAVLEQGLFDCESSVRVAAAAALGSVNGPGSADRILAALRPDGRFLMKEACIDGLSAMGLQALPSVVRELTSSFQAVREVGVRTLSRLGEAGMPETAQRLRLVLLDTGEDEWVRYWAIDGLLGMQDMLAESDRDRFTADLLHLLDENNVSPAVQLRAAYALGRIQDVMTFGQKQQTVERLAELFGEFGDDSRRSDAAFGWRIVGNALLGFGEQGLDALEALRLQRDNRWLAWNAYETVYAPQTMQRIVLCDEQEAIDVHNQYAPPFPGYRMW